MLDEKSERSALEENIKSNVKDSGLWLRLFYMVLFSVILYVVVLITAAVGTIQFVARIFSGKPLENLADFNGTLASYASDLVNFITYRSETKPFPFKE